MGWVRVALKMLPEPHQYWCGSGKPPQRTLWEGAQAAGIVRLTRVGMLLRGVAFAPITYNVLANEAGQRGGSIDTRQGRASRQSLDTPLPSNELVIVWRLGYDPFVLLELFTQ